MTLLAVLAVVSAASTCDEPPLYDVARIDVTPSEVHVIAGKSVRIRARLFDSYRRYLEPSLGYVIEWRSDDPDRVAVVANAGYDVVLRALTTTDPSPSSVVVRGKVLDREAVVTIAVIPSISLSGGELVIADHVDGDPPAVVVVDGKLGGAWTDDMTTAFAGAAVLPDLTPGAITDSAEITILSNNTRPGYFRPTPGNPVNWTVGDGLVSVSAGPVPPGRALVVQTVLLGPYDIPLRVWDASGLFLSEGSIRATIQAVNGIFADNRTGMQFSLRAPITQLAWTSASSNVCNELGEHFPSITSAEAAVPIANVFLVDAIASDENGVACLGPRTIGGTTVQGPVMVIRATSQSDVLAHELGHVLTLTEPAATYGHTNDMWEFDEASVMRAGGILRDYFSIGQAFRMGLDSLSWTFRGGFRTGGDIGRRCVPDVMQSWPCPRLAHPR